MKFYDVISHRSYEIDPESINVYATKHDAVGFIHLHECADKYKMPYGCGELIVSEKVWKKIVSTPRKSW